MSPSASPALSQFEQRIDAAMRAGQISAGGMPSIVSSISHSAHDDNISAHDLAAEVSRDAAIAARLIRVANSSLYGGLNRASTLVGAIARIGMATTRRLIMALSLADSAKPAHPALRDILAKQWTCSVEVAALSKVIAEHYTSVDPEEAFLAGLVHQIGVVPIVGIADGMPAIAGNRALVEGVIERLQANVGTSLLTTWRFPVAVAQVPLNLQNARREHAGAADLSDVVAIAASEASCHSLSKAPQSMAGTPAWFKLKLHEMGGLMLGVAMEKQLAEARDLFG